MEDCNQPVLRPNLTATSNPPTEAIPSTFRTTCSSGFGAHHLPKRLQPFLIIFVSSNLSKDQTFKAIQKALRFDQVIRFPTIKRALRALPDERPSDSHQRDMGWKLKGLFRTYWGSECSLGPLVQVTSPESQGAQHTACERCPLQKDQRNMLR